jgi:hypothetical protein
MTDPRYEKPLNEPFQIWQSMLNSTNTAAHILSHVSEDIWKVQSDAGSAWVTETLNATSSPPSPDDSGHALWQVPTLYDTQARRMTNTMLSTGSILIRGQQELQEWRAQIYSDNIERTTQTLARLLGAVANRRETADIINFADRRASSPSMAVNVTDELVSGQHKSSQRSNRQAQG